MLVDDIADRIAIAFGPELDDIVRNMWTDHTHGLLTEGDMEALDEAARTRREAIQKRRAPGGQRLRPVPEVAPRASVRRLQRSPDRQASIERRRRLVASGPLPPPLAARFTWGEIAVMRIIGDECRAKGFCDLHIDAIAARARREALQPRRYACVTKPRAAPSSAPRYPARRPQRSPDRQASIERRRRLVASGPLPPALAARFTWGEQAVMRIIGDDCRAKGFCDLHIDAIAARAGVHRTTAQNALREAQGRGEVSGTPIITVQERRRPGQRSLTNIVRVVSREWRNWLHKGPRHSTGAPRGEGSKSSVRPIQFNSKREDRPQKGPPWGIPDGVYPCEEVA